jgi:hypothetical protein
MAFSNCCSDLLSVPLNLSSDRRSQPIPHWIVLFRIISPLSIFNVDIATYLKHTSDTVAKVASAIVKVDRN